MHVNENDAGEPSMSTIDRLWEDHRQLCAQLDVLQATLTRVPPTWRQLRDRCVHLATTLEAHCEREAAAISACRDLIDSEALDQVAIEHWDRWTSLRIINRSLARDRVGTCKDISHALSAVIEGLREECHMQEQALFPVLECVMGLNPQVERFVLAAQ